MTLAYHPLANLFPLIEGAEFDALVADIAANGLHEWIVLLDGMILDGRNRYRAAMIAGREPVFVDFSGPSAPRMFADKDPLAWVLSKNMHRRHLSESQRAMVAARIATLKRGRPADDKPAGLPVLSEDAPAPEDSPASEPIATAPPAFTQAEAAEQLHVSERSVRTARQVLEKGAPELVEAVNAGRVSVSAAADLASLPPEDQRAAIKSADPAVLYSVIQESRAAKQAEKKVRREQRERDLGARQIALPDKRYGVILADPEWQFETWSEETGQDRSASNYYPTSTLEVIKARPVASIAADDCVLLLWATVPMLPEALAVMAAWGFAYKSHAVWLKDRIGTGYWFRNQHELLLVGTRGTIPAPAMGEQFRSALAHDVGEHSAKPPFAHEIAERYFPSLPKIELNARVRREGWDAWGLEAPNDPEGSAPDGSPAIQGENNDDQGDCGRACRVAGSGHDQIGRSEQPEERDDRDGGAEHDSRLLRPLGSADHRSGGAAAPVAAGAEEPEEHARPESRALLAGGVNLDAMADHIRSHQSPQNAITENELLEWKALSAVAFGVTVSGPLIEELRAQGLIWPEDLVLTPEGHQRGQYLQERVKAATSADDPDAVRVAAPSFTGWTDQAVATLRAGYADGLPSADIAKQLGTTPGAVFGKANRLGLTDNSRRGERTDLKASAHG